MRVLGPVSMLLAMTFLFATPSAEAQDGNLFRFLFGERPASQEREGGGGSSSKPRKQERRFSLFAQASPSGTVSRGKRVEIDLTEQKLFAYEGNRLVMRTRISSGRNGATPTGRYRAGPYKSEEHYSSLYQNAPMPWSVQVTGHIFIHGFSVVPDYPASHGCIRLPLTGRNPAKRFYRWCDVGTPIWIHY